MSILESIVLGVIQGLTEFLPISSSGHIEIGKVFLNLASGLIIFTLLIPILLIY